MHHLTPKQLEIHGGQSRNFHVNINKPRISLAHSHKKTKALGKNRDAEKEKIEDSKNRRSDQNKIKETFSNYHTQVGKSAFEEG